MKIITLPIKFEAIVTRHVNSLHEVLALKRVPHDGGFWQPVTGTLESNESLEHCLLRELKEETGLTGEDIHHISDCFFQFTWERDGVIYSEYVFQVEVHPHSEVALSDEHEDYQWITLPKAAELFEKNNNKNAVRKLEKILYGN